MAHLHGVCFTFLSYVPFFKNQYFSKKKVFRNTIGVSNSLDPDRDRRSVGPDLDPNYLQMFITADDRSRCWH